MVKLQLTPELVTVTVGSVIAPASLIAKPLIVRSLQGREGAFWSAVSVQTIIDSSLAKP